MKRLRILLLILFAVMTFLGTYGVQIEPQWLQVQHQTENLPHLDPIFNGFKVVQLSDFHISSLSDRLSNQVLTQLQHQAPDVIVLTGDFVSQGDNLEQVRSPLLSLLQKMSAIAPTIAVLGNHDYWADATAVQKILQQGQIQLLKNAVYTVTRSQAHLYFAGLDDVWVQRDRLEQVLAQLPDMDCAILLVHEPDFADAAAATERFDLELSGHSHAGQIRWGQPFTLPPLGRKYPAGRYQVRTMLHYTNRGLGTTIVPVRLGSRPEMTVFTLQNS